jgi:glycerol-3-phosphate acyltransferase PlsY
VKALGLFTGLALLGYLLGSIPFGKLIGRYHGVDIQKRGSGNIGFANTLRVLGWRPALAVLIGDSLKGFIAVALAGYYLPEQQVLAVGILAIIGHIYPVWLHFKGGKGVATGLGVALALNPMLGTVGLAMYVAAFSVFKKSAYSSMTAAWIMPIASILIAPELFWLFSGLALLATWTHRSYLRIAEIQHAH